MADLPISINTTGSEPFNSISARLRAEADTGLARELIDQVAGALKPLPQAARDNAISILPGSRRPDGLGQWLVQRTQITQVDQSDPGAAVIRVTATSEHDIALIDTGTVVHPLFGDRRYWYSENIRAGWWSTPATNVAPTVQTAAEQAVETVVQRIEA